MILKQSSSFDLMESAVRFTRLALLTVVHWTLFGRVKTGKSAQKSPKRILIMRFSAVGDFILAVPSINALRKAFPESEILLLTAASSNRAIRDSTVMYNLSSHPAPWVQFVHPSRVNEVVWIDSFELSSLRVNVRPKIEAFKPELAFILPQQEGGTVRSLITKMVFLRSLGVRCAVLGWRSGTGPLFRKRRYEAGRIEHAVSAPLKAVHEHRKLGKLDLNTVSFNLDIPEEDLKWADQLLRQQGCLEFKMVAVSLSSVQPHKQWGIEHFIALCQKLRQEEGVYVLLVGTKETREPGDEIVRLLGTRGLNLCGQTTITKLDIGRKKRAQRAVAQYLQRYSRDNDGQPRAIETQVFCPGETGKRDIAAPKQPIREELATS